MGKNIKRQVADWGKMDCKYATNEELVSTTANGCKKDQQLNIKMGKKQVLHNKNIPVADKHIK